MNTEKWEKIIYQIEEKFGVDRHEFEDFVVGETLQGKKIMGKKEIVEFKSPFGKMKFEKITKPKIIDKKILTSKRIGGRAAVDYIWSDTEESSFIKIYKEDNGVWGEVNPESLGY